MIKDRGVPDEGEVTEEEDESGEDVSMNEGNSDETAVVDDEDMDDTSSEGSLEASR